MLLKTNYFFLCTLVNSLIRQSLPYAQTDLIQQYFGHAELISRNNCHFCLVWLVSVLLRYHHLTWSGINMAFNHTRMLCFRWENKHLISGYCKDWLICAYEQTVQTVYILPDRFLRVADCFPNNDDSHQTGSLCRLIWITSLQHS